jgi:thiol-disulfide isomerase/thioredoxin|eukprot:Stramenopile-MAST_4_protein_6167
MCEQLNSAEEMDAVLEKQRTKLLVVEAYKDWCGPCEILCPTYDRILRTTENAENRVSFYAIGRSKHDLFTNIDKADSCRPVILFLREGQIKAKVSGANAPEIESLVSDMIPSND